MIKLSNLTKNYKDIIGCKDVSFSIKRGDIVGFVGPNGSGKTTVIRTMLGILKETSGSATIFNYKTNTKEFYKAFATLSYLSNETKFFKNFTVMELINYFSLFKSVNYDYLQYLINIFNLEVNKQYSELSLGNQKKVSIVIALMAKPNLLIMDEPTNGLDPLMQRVFFEELKQLNKTGTTIFLSSHILSDIEDLCERIILINKGQIVLDESLQKLRQETKTKIILINTKYEISFPGLTLKEQLTTTSKYSFSGNIEELVTFLFENDIRDFNIENRSLSDIIQKYYI